jgi:hypothetical protein
VQLSKPLSALTFEAFAMLDIGTSSLSLFGSFSLDDNFFLSASLSDLDWQAIVEIYEHFFEDTVPAPDLPVSLRRATLTISSALGLIIDIDHLSVGDFPPASGTLELSHHGISVSASVEGKALTVADLEISNPSIRIACMRSEKNAKADVMLSGDFHWETFTLKLGVHLYASPEDKGSLEYTICGEFILDEPTQGMRFDKLAPTLEHCPALGTVVLKQAALVVASRDDGRLPATMKMAYPIRKGCAL